MPDIPDEPSVAPKKGANDIREVARLSGVSISTVSRYLNQKVVSPAAEKRIAEAVRDLGTCPIESRAA